MPLSIADQEALSTETYTPSSITDFQSDKYTTDIKQVKDDEEASELVFNRPTTHLNHRTNLLKDRVDKIIPHLITALQPSEVVVAVAGDTTPVTEKVYVVTGSGTFNFMLPALQQ